MTATQRFETKDFFAEFEDPTVPGFFVIEVSDGDGPCRDRADAQGAYRIAEKWNRPNDDATWLTYWVSEDKLESRVNEGKCQFKRTATDEQFEGVLKLAGVSREKVSDANGLAAPTATEQPRGEP